MTLKELRDIFEVEGYYGLVEYVSPKDVEKIAAYDPLLAGAIYALSHAKEIIEERLSNDI